MIKYLVQSDSLSNFGIMNGDIVMAKMCNSLDDNDGIYLIYDGSNCVLSHAKQIKKNTFIIGKIISTSKFF